MRRHFPEFYERPSSEDLDALYHDATIVVDTNVLLALYKSSRKTRNQILGILRALRDRLWIPNQVALEFQRNRLAVIHSRNTAARKIINDTKSKIAKAIEELNRSDGEDQETNAVLIALSDTYTNLADFIKHATNEHVFPFSDATSDDKVRTALDELIGDHICEEPDREIRNKRIDEFATRSADGVPPGLGDLRKDTRQGAAADYLVWCEILCLAEQFERPLLFVTNDVKKNGSGDWYEPLDKKSSAPIQVSCASLPPYQVTATTNRLSKSFFKAPGPHSSSPCQTTLLMSLQQLKPRPKSNSRWTTAPRLSLRH